MALPSGVFSGAAGDALMGRLVASSPEPPREAAVLREIESRLGPAFSPAGMDVAMPRIPDSEVYRMQNYARNGYNRALAAYSAFAARNAARNAAQGGLPAPGPDAPRAPAANAPPARPSPASRPRSRFEAPLDFDVETVVPKLVAAAYAEEAAERLDRSMDSFVELCGESFLGKSAPKAMRRVLRLLQTRKGVMVLSNVLSLALTPLAPPGYKDNVRQLMLPTGALFSQLFVVPGAAERLAPVVCQYVSVTFERADLRAAGKVRAAGEDVIKALQDPAVWLTNLTPAQVLQLANSELYGVLAGYVASTARELARMEGGEGEVEGGASGAPLGPAGDGVEPFPAPSPAQAPPLPGQPAHSGPLPAPPTAPPSTSASGLPDAFSAVADITDLLGPPGLGNDPPGLYPGQGRLPGPQGRPDAPPPDERVLDIMDFIEGDPVKEILGGPAARAPAAPEAEETSGYVVLLSHIFDGIMFALRDRSIEPKPALAEFLTRACRVTQALPAGTGRRLCASSIQALAQAVRGRVRPCEQLAALDAGLAGL